MRSWILLFFIAFNAQAFVVISDLDDTIKISNSANTLRTIWRGLFSSEVYSGMPELLQAWKAGGASIHIVSASPSIIKLQVKDLLKDYKIPYDSLVLKGLIEDKYNFKIKAISRLIQNDSEDIVLMGDDAGKDREIFQEIAKRFPNRIKAVYVRPVSHKGVLPGQIPYLTSYDIAAHEMLEGRLGQEPAIHIAKVVLAASPKKVLPGFAWCPKDITEIDIPSRNPTLPEALSIVQFVEGICNARGTRSAKSLHVAESR